MRNPISNVGGQLERRALGPVLDVMHGPLRLTPNGISVLSFACGTAAVIAVLREQMTLAFALLAATLVLDVLDGALARRYKTSSQLGELLELVFDRVNEAMLLLALVIIGLAAFKTAALAITAILLTTSLRNKSNFDPGLKRVVLFLGYFANDYQLAVDLIFIANLSGFVISLIILDLQHQAHTDTASRHHAITKSSA